MLKKHKLIGSYIPDCLQQIPSPPKEIFIVGNFDEILKRPRLTVVGSRKVTPYGKAITEQLVSEAARAGVVIVSGLALGVDSIAHQAALSVGGLTVAVMPAGLHKIYPSSHTQLARRMLGQGGALISEYAEGMPPLKQNFVARNRLVAGLGDAILITEATVKSGTLHTVNFALEQGKPVLAVPGNITSMQSGGANNLIKSGAQVVTNIQDILDILHVKPPNAQQEIMANNEQEHVILTLLQDGISNGHELLDRSNLGTTIFNQTLTMLEITGRIKPLGNNHWAKN